ncbi:MAG TPA: amino acid adenylation domain-containing protein, partial [Candidatus Deferrimicrobium sp.]|nr:amino acid adenylation domain-containing protein [Candidatus Deferrimicrobium sp.]
VGHVGHVRPVRPVQLTYLHLNEQAGQVAGWLIEIGVLADNIVGIMMERSAEMITAIIGILKAGGAYLPIDPGYPQERIAYMLKDSNAKIIIENGQTFVPFHHSSFITHHPGHLAYIIYTSGSTGKPKGVMVEQRNVIRLLFNNKFQFEFNERDIWTMFHSFCFDFSVWEMYGALLYGAKLILVSKPAAQDLRKFLEIIKKQGVTVLNQIPSAFYNLIDLELKEPRTMSGIRYVIFGGEGLAPARLKEWQARYPGTKLINMYGITETTVHVTFKEIGPREIENGMSNIGKPIPTLNVYITDRAGHPVPVGVNGELVVGGDGVTRGYLNNPELTNTKFKIKNEKLKIKNESGALRANFHHSPFIIHHSNLYYSGDLGRWLPNGDIEYLGRIDQQVKIRGFRIELGEIESRLTKYPGIKEVVVTIQEEDSGDKYLCAYVVAENENTITGLRESLSKELPDYMIPSYFTPIEKIPLTPNGKLDREALPKPGVKASNGDNKITLNEREKKLAELWVEILSKNASHSSQLQKSIGPDDNFFDLGGHSLKANTLISKVHKTFDVKVSLASFFGNPTIRGLAVSIEAAVKERHLSIQPSEKKEYYPLTSAQQRLYFMYAQDPQSSGYNIPIMVTLDGTLDRNRLENVFKTLFQRHESFRTSFPLKEGKPVQVIHPEVRYGIEITKIPGDFFPESPDPAEVITKHVEAFIRPFDLGETPPVRVGLLEITGQRHVLMLDMHHIIMDGHSMGIFIKEFMMLYGGGRLAPLKIQYKDYSEWMAGAAQVEYIERQEVFWLNEFTAQPPALGLALDFVRPAVQTFAGDVVDFGFSREETAQIKAMVREENVTLFILVLTLYNICFSRLTGQEDIVIGTSFSGRRNTDLEPVIGMFIQTLALRNYPQPGKTFREFLHEVSKRTLQAFDNQDYPFEDLVEKLNISRDLSRNPIFDVMVELLNFEMPEARVSGLIIKPLPPKRIESKFDIDVQVREMGDELVFSTVYNQALFKKETIETLNGYFRQVMIYFMANPDHKIAQMELGGMLQKQEISSRFNENLEDE